MLDVIDAPQRKGLSASQRQQVLAHVARAPFSQDVRPLKAWARLASGRLTGKPHPSQPNQVVSEDTELTSVEYHVLKHTTLDDSWPPGTTPAEYLDDIRAAIRHISATLDVGRERVTYPNRTQRMAPRAATRTDVQALPALKVTVGAGTCIFVVYDPERAKILSGYRLATDDAEDTLAKWKPRYSL
jgi:hypothetical protein